ncbi:MAG: hypothetical protein KDB07_09755, partial [Planctomycetes bacterium]|nr:hypothetical protein [Planctomycetota bacterium]
MSGKFLTTCFCALLAVLGAATASGAEIVIQKNYGSSTNVYPFYYHMFRYQFVIQAADFGGETGKISEFGFQFSYAPRNITYPNAEIRMGQTAKTPSSFSSTYAQNYDLDGPVTVKSGGLTVNTTTSPQYIRFVLDQPYNYDGQGNLTVEIYMPTAPSSTSYPGFRYGSNSASCRVYSYNNSTATSGSKGTNFAQNWEMLLETGSTWTGANSSDWNDPGNWDGEIPTFELGAEIPDAATTPNDPVLPDGGEAQGLALLSNSVVLGSTGTFKVFEDWENEGGIYSPQGTVIEYAGSGKQSITSGLNSIGSIRISNTSDTVTFVDECSAANTGTFALDQGSVLKFDSDTLNFTGVTFQNAGTINLGLDGGGTVVTLQSITTSGQNLGNVAISVLDAMDS